MSYVVIGFSCKGTIVVVIVVDPSHSETLVEFSSVENRVIVVVWHFLESDSFAESRGLLHEIIVLVLVLLQEREALKAWLVEFLFLERQFFFVLAAALGDYSGFVASDSDWFCVFLSLFGRLFRFLILVAFVVVLALFLILGLVVLADVDEGLVDFLIGLLESVDAAKRQEAVGQFVLSADDADELVLHGLDGFHDFLAFEGVIEVADHEEEVLLLQVLHTLESVFGFALGLFQQSVLEFFEELVDLK